jgi:hypothetical protein
VLLGHGVRLFAGPCRKLFLVIGLAEPTYTRKKGCFFMSGAMVGVCQASGVEGLGADQGASEGAGPTRGPGFVNACQVAVAGGGNALRVAYESKRVLAKGSKSGKRKGHHGGVV